VAERGAVDPEHLVAALKAAGFAELARAPDCVRIDFPPGALTIPLDPAHTGYRYLIDEVVNALRDVADVGARARKVLDALEGCGDGA
jgi:hypothetical protein